MSVPAPTFIAGLDDPQDAPVVRYVPSLEERLTGMGFDAWEIEIALGEPAEYARTHGARQ